MKKNLFYLFIALFAVTFMTACGDDDDDKEGDKTAETIAKEAGTYTQGKISIYVLGDAIGSWDELPETVTFEVTQNLNVELTSAGTGNVDLTIKDLDLTDGSDPSADRMSLSVSGVPVTAVDGSLVINSTNKTWSVPIMNGFFADVNKIEGTIKDGQMNLQLSAFQNDLEQYVYIIVAVSK